MRSDEHSIIKNYFIVIILTFASNLCGFIKEIMIAAYFGISEHVDTYVVAFSFVSIFTMMFAAGPLQGAFIPLFTRYYEEKAEKGWSFYSDVINLIAIFCILLSVAIFLMTAFAPSVLQMIAPGFDAVQIDNLAEYINILLIILVLIPVGVVFISVLQVKGNFATSVSPPIFNNIVIMLAMMFFVGKMGIYSLLWGLVAGALVSFLWLLYFVSRHKPRYRPIKIRFDYRLKETIFFMVPMGMLIFVDQIGALIQKSIVSVTGSGNIAVLNYAYKLVGIPVGLFGMGIATVIFPTLAALIAQKKDELVEEKIANGLNFVIYTMVPIMVFFIAYCLPLVKLVYERGAFETESSLMTARALQIYSIGMLGQALIMLLHRIFFAFGDSKIPLKIGLATAAVHILLCFFLVRRFDYLGVPLSTSIYAYVYTALLFFYVMKKHIKFAFAPPLKLVFKVGVLAAASAAIPSLLLQNSIGFKVYNIIVYLAFYTIAFLVLTYIFRINETKIVMQTFNKYLLRRKA